MGHRADEPFPAYNGTAEMPRFYAGAPYWVANPVLNPRADGGLLSFCHWWDAGRWYRGESPPASDCGSASGTARRADDYGRN